MRPIRSLVSKTLLLAGLAITSSSIGAEGLRYTRLLCVDVSKALHGATAPGSDARQKQIATLESLLMTKKVTVGIDADSDDGDARRVEGLRAGLRIWQTGLQDCPFREANGDENPDVIVKFVDDIPDGGDLAGEIEAGRQIQWSRNFRSYTLTGRMLVKAHAGRRRLTQAEITEVVAHELGHLLGLDDDEQRMDGLMGPFEPGHPRPYASDEELQTVIAARDQMRSKIANLCRGR